MFLSLPLYSCNSSFSLSFSSPMERNSSIKSSIGYLRFFTLLLFLFLLSTSDALQSSSATTIHDLLRNNGLPGGLFPKSVKSFDLDEETGILQVNLYGPCYAKYDNLAYFDQVVRANLSYGELKGVEGLSQEELFLWLPVKGIVVSDPKSGVILFDIGVAHKQLSLSLFDVPRDCKPAGREEEMIRTGLIRMSGRKGRGGFQPER